MWQNFSVAAALSQKDHEEVSEVLVVLEGVAASAAEHN
jgi:hypothetical protein